MAEITRQRSGELMRGVFEILLPHADGLPAKEVLRKIEEVVPPTPFEASDYPSTPGVRRYERIIRFSTIPAVKAGWLIKNKGQWVLTDQGRWAFGKWENPAEFMQVVAQLYRQWKKEQPQEEQAEQETESSPETAATTLEESEEAAWSEIEAYLSEMSPYDFQELVAGLLRGMGYHVAWISPPGPDRGLDVIAHSDPLGITGPRIKVQVKRRADKIDVDGVRSFMALLAEGDVGLFVCAGGFTKNAEAEARHQERRRIMLVDLKRLFDLWVEHYGQIPEIKRRLLPLRPVYFLETVD
jgi:restriction system protein